MIVKAIDAAADLHRVAGIVFTLWLVVAGARCGRRGPNRGSRIGVRHRGAATTALLALAACVH